MERNTIIRNAAAIGVVAIILCANFNGNDTALTKQKYHTGQYLPPCYAHPDTGFIVMDGEGLSRAMQNAATDEEIDSVLRLFCEPHNP